MSLSLEDRIRTAVKHGGLISVSLYASGNEWVCCYLNDSGKPRQFTTDADPIKALEKGITPLKQPGERVRDAVAVKPSEKRRSQPIRPEQVRPKRREDDDLL